MQKSLKWFTIVGLFLIPIFPLIVANSFFFPYITGKAFYFRILVELVFSSWLILAFLDAKYRPKFTPLTAAVTIFAFVALVADLIGVNPIRSLWSNFERMEGWITIIHLWAFFLVSTCMFGASTTAVGADGAAASGAVSGADVAEAKRWWHRWMNVSILVAITVAIEGIVQLVQSGGARVDASLGNAAYMAVYMLLNAGFAAYLFFVARRKAIQGYAFLQWAYPILFVLFSFVLYETATRGTTLGLIGGVMLSCALYAVFGTGESKKARYICGGAIILIIVLGGAFWLDRGAAWIQHNDILERFATISWNDTSNQARQYIWPMALKGASERPILGWGQENFNYIFNANYNPKMWAQEQWFDRAHDVYLDWLINAGLVGLIAYLALYFLFLRAVWKSSLSIAEKSVLTGLLAGYAVHNIFVFDNLASYVLFFALLAFVDSFRHGTRIARLGTQPVRRDAVEYIVAPITIVLLIGIVYFFNVRPIQANTDLIGGLESCQSQSPDPSGFQGALNVGAYVAFQETREQLLSCASTIIASPSVPDQTKEAFYSLSLQEIQAQIAATPKDARIYALAGAFFNQIGQYGQAESLLRTAQQLSPGKQSIDLELANAYIDSGTIAPALSLLSADYAAAPDDTDVASVYAVALVLNGQEAQARSMFVNDPTIFDNATMAQAYMALKEYGKGLAIYESLASSSPTDVSVQAQLANAQYTAGMKAAAVRTLQGIEAAHPELKAQVDQAIQQAEQ